MNEMLFRTSAPSTSQLATLPLAFQNKTFLFFFFFLAENACFRIRADSEPEGASNSGDDWSCFESALVPGELLTKDVVAHCRDQTYLPFKHTLIKLCLFENGHYFYKDAL